MPAAHHWLWLSLMCDESIRKLLILAPPESAKTTWTISAFVGTYTGFYPERSVVIGSTSGEVAQKRSMSLRTTVETEAYRLTFPNVLPVKSAQGLKWAPNEWSLAPGGIPHPGRLHPTVAAYGTGGSVIGSRADLVIGDDLLDFDNTRTAHQRDTVSQWIHNSLLSRRKSRTGRVVMIGTAWHHADYYMQAEKEGGWVICRVPLLTEGDKFYAYITYPDGWTGNVLGEPVAGARL